VSSRAQGKGNKETGHDGSAKDEDSGLYDLPASLVLILIL
jgi:hypothetical protein